MAPMLVVAAFAFVQSLFGVGLLVFGTPSLLLLGYPFVSALAILLPASITISLLQALKQRSRPDASIRLFALWCLPALAITLGMVLLLNLRTSLDLAVALLLAVFVALRLSPRMGASAARWVNVYQKPWLVLMGVVHGISNLGGALLVVFAASQRSRKEDVRAIVAVCYAGLAAVQMMVLVVLAPGIFRWSQLSFAAVAGLVFVLVGERAFTKVSTVAFDRLLTLFAAMYAALLGLRAAGFP